MQNVHPAVALQACVDQALALSFLGDIADMRRRLTAGFLDQAARFFKRCFIAVNEKYLRPLSGEDKGGRAAIPEDLATWVLASANDNGDLVL
jgi:hypothetical protein